MWPFTEKYWVVQLILPRRVKIVRSYKRPRPVYESTGSETVLDGSIVGSDMALERLDYWSKALALPKGK